MSAPWRGFASDNYAGVCPEAMAAFVAANAGHAPAYGEDEWTRKVSDRLRTLFETDCDVYFVFNGTAANSLALAALCQSYHSVVCHELAHVQTDECGGPEFFSNGSKLLPAHGEQGKLTPAAVLEVISRRSDIHYPKPRVVTLTQSTEVGTVYRPDEVAAISAICTGNPALTEMLAALAEPLIVGHEEQLVLAVEQFGNRHRSAAIGWLDDAGVPVSGGGDRGTQSARVRRDDLHRSRTGWRRHARRPCPPPACP